MNRASSLLGRKAGSAASSVADAAGSTASSVADAAGSAVDTATSAAGKAIDTAVTQVEAVAEDVTGATTAGVEKAQQADSDAVDQVLDLTGLDEQHEPFPAYSRLSGDSVMRHVADSDDIEHLREILSYEQAHKARKGVVQALESRLEELSTTV